MSQDLLYSDAGQGPSSDDRVRQVMRDNRSRIEENTQRLSDLLEPWKGGGMEAADSFEDVAVARREAASTGRVVVEGLSAAGAVSILFIWSLTSSGVDVPGEAGGAIGVIVSGFAGAVFSKLRDWGIFQ